MFPKVTLWKFHSNSSYVGYHFIFPAQSALNAPSPTYHLLNSIPFPNYLHQKHHNNQSLIFQEIFKMLFVISEALLDHKKYVLNVTSFLSKRNAMEIHHFINSLDSHTHLSYFTNISVQPNFNYLLIYPSAFIINNSGVFSYEGDIRLKVSVLILKDNKSKKWRPDLGSCNDGQIKITHSFFLLLFRKQHSQRDVGSYPIGQMRPSQAMIEILVAYIHLIFV